MEKQDIVQKNIISDLFWGYISSCVEDKIDEQRFKRQVLKIDKKLDDYMEAVDDLILREQIQQFIRGELLKIIGTDYEISEEIIIRKFQTKYKGYIPNDIKKIIIQSLNMIVDEMFEIFSPEQRVILSVCIENNKMLNQLISIKQKDRKVQAPRCLESKNENKEDTNSFKKVWNSELFLEGEKDKKKLLDVFVKTNFERIIISRIENCKRDRKRNNEKHEVEKRDIEKKSKYYWQVLNGNIEEYTVEAALRHYEEDIDKSSNLDDVLLDFVQSNNKVCIIMGQPGSGKSSLLAYLAGDFFENRKDCLFVILSKVTYKESLLQSICYYLKMTPEQLENKNIILDGFDEMVVLENVEKIFANFINDVKNQYIQVKFFITTRENYIDILNADFLLYYKECTIIRLKNFGLIQMIDFHKKYKKEIISYERLKALNMEKEVFGIPLILYIIYSLELDINKDTDKYMLYNKIFSTENGIYDKCNSGTGGYGTRGRKLSIEDKESFHRISQKIAFLMYTSGTLEVSHEDVEQSIKGCGYTEMSLKNYLHNNYYEKNMNMQIKFKHKSFYEYFLAEYLFNYIVEVLCEDNSIEQQCQSICELLVIGRIEDEVFKHFNSKKNFEKVISIEEFSPMLSKCVEKIILYGGMHFVNSCIEANVLRGEANIFFNIMKISKIILADEEDKIAWSEELRLITNEMNNLQLFDYLEPHLIDSILLPNIELQLVNMSYENVECLKKGIWMGRMIASQTLSNINMTGSYLGCSIMSKCRFERSTFCDSDFRNSFLTDVSFINSNLLGADFQNCIFQNVAFIRVKIEKVTFKGSIMKNVIFDEECLPLLKEQGVDLDNIIVYCLKTRKEMLYQEYVNKDI